MYVAQYRFVIAVRSFVIASLVTFGASCTANYPEGPTPTPTLAGIQIHYLSSHAFVIPRSAAAPELLAIDTEGILQDVTTRASWVSGNTSIFAAASNGTVRRRLNGTADVIATYQGLTTTAPIAVSSNLPALSMELPSTIQVGETRQATARQRNIARTDVTSRSTCDVV